MFLLINFISTDIYDLISSVKSYDEAIVALKSLFTKQKNFVFNRHLLASRKQDEGESLNDFLRSLQTLSKDCGFEDVTAEVYREESIRDALITGLRSATIRQRLLENDVLTLDCAMKQALSLEQAQLHADRYAHSPFIVNASAAEVQCQNCTHHESSSLELAAIKKPTSCSFCGKSFHSRLLCPANNVTCNACGKRGHFSKVCRSKTNIKSNTAAISSILGSASLSSQNKSITSVLINNKLLEALIDSGSSESFINLTTANQLKLTIMPSTSIVSMASSTHTITVKGHCIVDVSVFGNVYSQLRLSVMSNLCSPVILGRDFMSQHESVNFKCGGSLPHITISYLESMTLTPIRLFSNLSSDCHPISTKSRSFSNLNQKFISEEVSKLLSDGIIEPSQSPWRAQVLVTGSHSHKSRMVIDYSRTINNYT